MRKEVERLNQGSAVERLRTLRSLKAEIDETSFSYPKRGTDVNNHIHTTYSFSPYTPTMALWRAQTAGLCTAGIVDHDSVSGVREFIEAGRILDFPITVGAEIRSDHTATAIGDRRSNNPDQTGIAYLAMHGIPHGSLDNMEEFLRPIRVSRGKRNRLMCEKLVKIVDIPLNYDQDVLPLSMACEGGSVTERHLLYALSLKMIEEYGRGETLIQPIEKFMPLSVKERGILNNIQDQWYDYRLLGIFKARLVDRFYIPADTEECPDIYKVVSFANENGIILTYPYLGDVDESPTGDKKAQAFEDSYLDDLFASLNELGFKSVSYMPSRNTMEQITRLRALCDYYGMLQITGEDINSPFQSFICTAQHDPTFSNLYDTTLALIGHEIAASKNLADGFLNVDMPLREKVEHFKRIACTL